MKIVVKREEVDTPPFSLLFSPMYILTIFEVQYQIYEESLDNSFGIDPFVMYKGKAGGGTAGGR